MPESSLDYYMGSLVQYATSWVTHLFSTGDPLTVSLVLFILLSPFALVYMVFSKVGFIRLTQMDIKGQNILYVIAHPDDEAM